MFPPPACAPVTNPYGALCTNATDDVYKFACTVDTQICSNPSKWAIFTDPVENKTFGWDSGH